MVIERKYVPFSVLHNRDKESWKIFKKAFDASYPKEDHDRMLNILLHQCLYQKDMGWCFERLEEVINGFERLDKEKPYDNGFSYADVNETIIASRNEECLTLHLIHRFDGIDNIVQIVKFANREV